MSEGGAKLVWPPTKEDLQRLYLVERLSAAKIARVYGLKYASEKTAESTVLYHLNRNGIVRRDKAEHIKKIIEEMVEEWINRYQEGESLKQIAGASVDPVSVWNHLRKKGVKLRDKVEAQIEAVTKHQKTSFHGNLIEKAYIIGLRVGDLNAVRHGRAIRARVSTTHPAMMELFTGIFAEYWHVHKYPKKTPQTEWEWSLECDLDSSFEFLLDPAAEFRWIFESGAFFIAFLAGFFDADGSVYYHRKRARGGFEFTLTNMDDTLLQSITEILTRMEFHPRLRRAPQKIERGVKNGSQSIWRMSIWRYEDVSRILRLLPIRHREKRTKRDLALRLGFRSPTPNRTPLIEEWDKTRRFIKGECATCILQAREAYQGRKAVPIRPESLEQIALGE